MARYRITAPAMEDLHQIWDYYSSEASEGVADQQLDRLYHRFLLLAKQPYMVWHDLSSTRRYAATRCPIPVTSSSTSRAASGLRSRESYMAAGS